jgi:hypothetical protein
MRFLVIGNTQKPSVFLLALPESQKNGSPIVRLWRKAEGKLRLWRSNFLGCEIWVKREQSLDLHEEPDQFALPMRFGLGKHGFRLIARRLAGNLQLSGGDIGMRAARDRAWLPKG